MTADPALDAEIAARYDDGESIDDLALAYNLPRSTIGALIRRVTEPRPVGRRPSGAVTHHTARGRAALATALADATAAGLEIEVYLDRARQAIAAD